MAHCSGPLVDGRARPARPGGVGPPQLRHQPDLVPLGVGLPGGEDDGDGGLVADPGGAGGRPLPALRRRVRPPRALRRARAVDVPLRPRLVGAQGDLAAVHGEGGGVGRLGCPDRGAHPGELRGEAVVHRPLARAGARRLRLARPVGRHRAHPLHRPRALPGRARHLREAGGSSLPAARAHSSVGGVAWAAGGGGGRFNHQRRYPCDAVRALRGGA